MLQHIRLMISISEEYVLSGAHVCSISFQGDVILLIEISWILKTAWETLALFLAVWIVVKHFRTMPRPLAGQTIGNWFPVLITVYAL